MKLEKQTFLKCDLCGSSAFYEDGKPAPDGWATIDRPVGSCGSKALHVCPACAQLIRRDTER